jgi:hypothetical protein
MCHVHWPSFQSSLVALAHSSPAKFQPNPHANLVHAYLILKFFYMWKVVAELY